MTQREQLKNILRPIILNEIAFSDFGTPKKHENSELVDKIDGVTNGSAKVEEVPQNGKILVGDKAGGKRFSIEITEGAGNELFNFVAITNGSDRVSKINVPFDELKELLKTYTKTKESDSYVAKAEDKTAKPSDSYVAKAEDKTVKPKEVSKKEVTDDIDEELIVNRIVSQKEIGDSTTKAEDAVCVKKNAPVKAMGGEFVDDIDRVVDRLFNDKSFKSAKADKKNESSDKLVVPIKSTPTFKK